MDLAACAIMAYSVAAAVDPSKQLYRYDAGWPKKPLTPLKISEHEGVAPGRATFRALSQRVSP